MQRTTIAACLAVFLTAAACSDDKPADRRVEPHAKPAAETSAKRAIETSAERIVGSWVIDAKAQKAEIARVSPSELEDFDAAFRTNLAPIRETFHSDGRYEVTSPLGGPYEDHWEFVSEDETSVTIRSSGHSWVARRAAIGAQTHERSASVLIYTFSDPDHMVVTTRIALFGEEKGVSYFFVRDE